MRLSSDLTADGTESYGVFRDGKLHDACKTLRSTFPDLRAALTAGALDQVKAAAETGDVLDMADITLLLPMPNPDKIICIGLNYMTHITETGRPSRPSRRSLRAIRPPSSATTSP